MDWKVTRGNTVPNSITIIIITIIIIFVSIVIIITTARIKPLGGLLEEGFVCER